tara:strand:- start:19857 stop:23477 length:3621 start_codon:yes stop_codon:yes gene_type:complete
MERKSLQIYKNLEKKDFKELYSIYYDNKRNFLKTKDKKSLYLMKMIEKVVDVKNIDESENRIINNSYQSYPDYNNPSFNTEITKKAEFFHCKGLLDLIELDTKCFPSNFELGNHQKFLKNFMNKNTPYKGLLVFHGVGVGKTCTAITISNSFIDLYKKEDKKIICLVSKNIQSNWMNTIYSPEKGDNQCNGENFQNIIHNIDMKMNTSFKVKKLIREYYEFYGYQQFSNKVKQLIELKTSTTQSVEEIEKKIIKKYFSNRLLIIDEVHNLRDDNLDKYSKDTVKFLDKVIKYSDNLRLVLLSATPMFNKATEIQWLINLLLKNDKRPTISKNEIFDENETLTERGIDLLKKKTRGYISYVRGENPITFPIRLYPDNNNDPLCINGDKGNEYPKLSIKGEEYNDSVYQFKFLKMYYNQMDNYQSQIYKQYVESLNSETMQISEQRAGVQISNIVYPPVNVLTGKEEINRSNFHKMYGGTALFNSDLGIMKPSKNNKYRYSNSYRKNIQSPIFDIENIGVLSTKIKNILEGLQKSKSKGIIFIYTEFIPSGVFPLAFALEHMGFEKYSGNILEYPEWKKDEEGTKREPIDFEWNPISKKGKGNFKQAKYIVLSGNKGLSPNNDEEIKALTSEKNKNGENIKIVIGTVVASEGLDLKNVREVHILDPWYHLSRVEQIIGRGIRFCSHINLEKEERNVTVYMHVAGINKEMDSIDTYTYRKAEEKAVIIGEIETVLKENAIDCYLNKQINHIQKNQIKPINLITSRGIKINKHEVYDKEYSKICSFSKCNFNCECSDVSENDINYDTFTLKNSKDLFIQVKKVIIEMFEVINYYTLHEIIAQVMETIDTNIPVIYYTLYDMIDNKYMLWNNKNISGYLINKNNYYLFQPHNNSDKTLPLYYRTNSIQGVQSKYLPLVDNLFSKKVKKEKGITPGEIYKKIIQELSKEDIFLEEYSFENFIDNFDTNNYEEYIFDSLSYKEKIIIFKDILKEYIENRKLNNELKDKLFTYFQGNLIYEEDLNYFILEKKKNIVGFFVFNTDSFYSKKKEKYKELDLIENDYSYYIYKNKKFYNLSELSDSELIQSSIKSNFLKIKETTSVLKNESIWGYPFKLEDGKTVFKLVDDKIKAPNKLPGRIVSQIAKKNSVRAFLRIYFKTNYDKLIKDDPDIENQTKNFLYLLIEMIIRNKEKLKKKNRHLFIPYDLIFLNFLE